MRRLLGVVLVFAFLLMPGAASAAGTVAVPPPSLDVQLWPSEQGGALLLVTVEASEDVVLPYEARVPLPAGAEVVWVGEVTGRGPSTDIERPHTVVDGTGGKVLVFTLTTVKVGQYEARLPAPTETAGRSTSSVEWVQSVTTGAIDFSVKFVATAGDVRVDPTPAGPPQVNAANESLYTLPSQTLARGSKYVLTASFTRVASGGATATASPSGSAAPGGGSALLAVLGGLLVLAVAAFVVELLRERRVAPESDEPTVPGSPTGARDPLAPREPEHPEPGLSDDPFDLD